MKMYLTVSLLSLMFLSSAFAKTEAKTERKLAAVSSCKQTALQAVKYVDKLGWGEVASEPVKIISAKSEDQNVEVLVKSTVSGYTYKVTVFQDQRSESCIITSIATL